MKKSVRKILIANRGEPVSRIAKTLRKLGLIVVGMCATNESENASHAKWCDEMIVLPKVGLDAYLDQESIVALAQQRSVDAIHPAWGFLSERAEFSAAVEAAGMIFIGPTAESMKALGDKESAKKLALALSVPTIQYVSESDVSPGFFLEEASKMKFPLLLKPLAGGGGKGMLLVKSPAELKSLYEQAHREAQASFGDGRLMAEPFLLKPRHVEVQILGDGQGQVWCLGERDCTVQRRHQKVIEEAPSVHLTLELRQDIYAAAVQLTKYVAYRSAGTVEFILDQSGLFYFMEVNTRLQVEHGVTEELWDLDLVECQIKLAMGENIEPLLKDKKPEGHVMQARVYAEDPYENFLPSMGSLRHVSLPKPSTQLRLDHAICEGDVVDFTFDPMLMKMITRGRTRDEAMQNLHQALEQTSILGLHTNLNYLQWLLLNEDFGSSRHHTQWTAETLEHYRSWEKSYDPSLLLAAVSSRQESSTAEDLSPGDERPSAWDAIISWKQGQS